MIYPPLSVLDVLSQSEIYCNIDRIPEIIRKFTPSPPPSSDHVKGQQSSGLVGSNFRHLMGVRRKIWWRVLFITRWESNNFMIYETYSLSTVISFPQHTSYDILELCLDVIVYCTIKDIVCFFTYMYLRFLLISLCFDTLYSNSVFIFLIIILNGNIGDLLSSLSRARWCTNDWLVVELFSLCKTFLQVMVLLSKEQRVTDSAPGISLASLGWSELTLWTYLY